MDTSEKYIEMCRAAEEIQKTWEPNDGDYYRYFILDNPQVYIRSARRGVDPIDPEHWIWLPRQDQLQEMITNDEYLYRTEFGKSSGALFEAITEFAHRGDCGKSFEMLWLIFVMERKFKKFWDGSSWKVLP